MKNETTFYYSIANTISPNHVLIECKAKEIILKKVYKELYSIIDDKENIWHLNNGDEYVISVRQETNGCVMPVHLRISFKVIDNIMQLTTKRPY